MDVVTFSHIGTYIAMSLSMDAHFCATDSGDEVCCPRFLDMSVILLKFVWDKVTRPYTAHTAVYWMLNSLLNYKKNCPRSSSDLSLIHI